MPLNWTTGDLMVPAGCLPCCVAPAVTCYLTLPPPIGASPYANVNVATDVISNQTSGCLGFIDATSFVGFTASSNNTASNVSASGNVATSGVPFYFWTGLSGGSGDAISIDYTLVGGFGGSFSANIWDANGNVVESFTSASNGNPFVSAGLPADGCYALEFGASALLMPNETLTATAIVTTNGAFSPSGIRAAYGNVPDYLVCV